MKEKEISKLILAFKRKRNYTKNMYFYSDKSLLLKLILPLLLLAPIPVYFTSFWVLAIILDVLLLLINFLYFRTNYYCYLSNKTLLIKKWWIYKKIPVKNITLLRQSGLFTKSVKIYYRNKKGKIAKTYASPKEIKIFKQTILDRLTSN